MDFLRAVAVIAAFGLVLGFVQSGEPVAAGAASAPSSVPSARSVRMTAAEDAASVKARAQASVWVPGAPIAPPADLATSPSTPFTPSVSTGAGGQDTSLESFTVGGVSVAVDRVTGHLRLAETDLTVAGAGTSVAFARVFDGRSREQSRLGTGWTSSLETGLRVEGANLVLYTDQGDRDVFEGDGVGGFRPAGGLTMTRVSESPERTFRTTDTSGNTDYYSVNGYRTAEFDRSGRGIVYRYLDDGSPALAQEPVTGRFLAFDYSGKTLVGVHDSSGRRVTYEHDDTGRLTKIVGVGGAETTLRYDDDGNLVEIGAPSSVVRVPTTHVTLTYDARSRVTSLAREADQISGSHNPVVTAFRYSATSTVVTDALGNSTSYSFDDRGHLTAMTDASGAVSSATWSGDQMNSMTDATGAVMKFDHDATGRLTGSELPTGASTRIDFDASSGCGGSGGSPDDARCTVDADGNSTAFDYDRFGNRIEVRDSLGVTAQNLYSSSTDPASCSPVAGLVCLSVDGNGVATSYRYDAAGELTERGVMTAPGEPLLDYSIYTYDSIGRLSSVSTATRSDAVPVSVTTLSYDIRDSVVRIVKTGFDASDNWIGYNTDGSTAFRLVDDRYLERYTYDRLGNITLDSAEDAVGGSVAFSHFQSYDAAGNVLSVVTATETTSYTYTSRGLLASIQENDGDCSAGVRCITFDYDANGNETARHFLGVGDQRSEYDASGRLVGRSAVDSDGAEKVRQRYSYTDAKGEDTGLVQFIDRADPLRYRTDQTGAAVPVYETTAYSYDARGRMLSAVEKSPDPQTWQMQTLASWGYAYDGAGNRVSQTRSGDTGAHPAPGGQLYRPFDTAAVTSVDTPPSTVTYRYDALNRIEGSTADTSAWAYDQNGTEWRNGISQVNAALLPPTPPPSGTNPQSFILTPAGETVGYRDSIGSHYFVKDNVGSVIGIFGAKGQNEDTSTSFEGSYSYSPFGELRAASSGVENNRVRFAGALADPTHPEIYTMGARIYDASLGRFLQSDPSAPGRSSYDYAVQNPVNFVDTNGLNPKTSAASGFVAAMFAIIAGAACATDSLGLCYGVSVYSAFATSALASLATWGIFRSGPVIWVEDTLILFGWALFRFIMSRLIVRIEADQRRERDSATNSARIAAVKRSLGRLADQATQANDAEKTRLKQLANAAVAEKEEALKKAAELAAQVKYTSEERDLARRELQLLREKIAALAQETHHRDDTSEATLDVAIRCTLPNGIQRTYEFSGNL